MNDRMWTGGSSVEPCIRRALIVLVTIGTAVFLFDLVLLEHVDSALQWTPVVALAVGVVVALAAALRPTPAALVAFRAVMSVFVVLGVLGIYLHYRSNILFELEMDPVRGGPGLLWAAARGGVPTLAPAGLAGLGLLGWIATVRHPAFRRATNAD